MDPEKKMEEGNHEAVDADVKKHQINWPLLIVNSILMACGTIGGPLVLRLYYLHGGRRKWLTSCLQTAGFPVLIIPLSILFLRDRARGVSSIAEPRLMVWSGGIGLLAGIVNFMYSYGLSYLPVSTSSLLFSTQLGFTAFFAFILVKQRFTPYSINAIVLMTMGSVLLGLRQSGDRPPNVSRGEYLLGFFIMFGAASVLGFILPSTELAYSQVKKAINFTVVLQFQIGLSFAATVFSTIGMLVNGDFSAMGREAKAFDLGETKYYLLVTMSPLVFQMTFVGALGVIFSASSLFAGVLGAAILPLTEIAGVIIYHEKFTGEKGMALALCLWGFSSYFYGAFKNQKKQERKEKQSK